MTHYLIGDQGCEIIGVAPSLNAAKEFSIKFLKREVRKEFFLPKSTPIEVTFLPDKSKSGSVDVLVTSPDDNEIDETWLSLDPVKLVGAK